MLDSEVVEAGWISEADFLTGIALVQAMPGPLFNIAAYVGKLLLCLNLAQVCCQYNYALPQGVLGLH